jgi:nucleoside-diphosphate-sugar epimerase
MRVVVVGATGNLGTSLVRALTVDAAVGSILGLARRLPELDVPKVEWAAADVSVDDLVPFFRGADCVVHLAWLIQPSHDREQLWRVNVGGSERVFRAVVEAGVGSLVYASSVGTYAPGPKDRRVDETWPTTGIATSQYSLQKAETERLLDRLETEQPRLRVVRLRPALIFKRESASEQRRLFAGPLLPTALLRRGRIPFVPDVPRLVFQAVHADDAADAYRRAVVGDARGAFNVAAEPAIGPAELAKLLGARRLRVPAQLLRGAAQLTWRLRLQPSSVGWVDMGLGVPLLDSSRAREELGWTPVHGGLDALAELLDGMHDRAGAPTPPLQPA